MSLSRSLAALLGCCLAALSLMAIAKDYKTTGTGWSIGSAAADVDGDMNGGFVGDEAGTGSFGKFTQQTVGDTVFVGGFCGPEEIELLYVSITSILRAANGDLLYRKLNSSSPSRICFNFVNQKAEFTAHFDVVGGTGRFKGATGSAIQTGTVESLGSQSGVEFSETGNLVLLSPGGDDDD